MTPKERPRYLWNNSSRFLRRTRRYLPPIPPNVLVVTFHHLLLNLNEWRNLININTSKAEGPDNISNTVFKNCASQLSPALATIFQCSIDSGKLPSDWLSVNVSPVFKKGDSYLAENYKPVSLTCVSCKLLEHIVCKHLLDHLERHNILTSVNHGFHSGFSCEIKLLTTIHDLLQHTTWAPR